MAIFYDFVRTDRVKGDEFCSLAGELLTGERSVLALGKKCHWIRRSRCNGCFDSASAPETSVVDGDDVKLLA